MAFLKPLLLLLLLVARCSSEATAQQLQVPDAASPASKADIVPAVVGKVMPIFFERASKVVIQLVRDKLSSVRLGELETYADGETPFSALVSHHISA